MTDPDPAIPSEEPARLFLSYARADRQVAEKLAAALKQAGHEVWWDSLIEAGEVFTTSIEKALDAADAVIVLWSRTSVQSDWVRDEAARGRDRKRLVPVTIDGSEAPLGFRQYHVIDISAWQKNAKAPVFGELLRGIAAAAGRPVPIRATPPPAVPRRRFLAIGAGGITVAAGGFALWQGGVLDGDPVARSIAVLPFKNLSSDPDQLYFSDGLTEEVRSALARNDGFEVLAATSSETARAHKEDAVTISSRLGVAYLLEGSVRRAGDVVRISAELIDGKTGFGKWSNSFDRKMTDIFTLQNEIARLVSEALSVQMATSAPQTGGTTNVAAYEAFLRGRSLFLNASDEATDRAALAQFDMALASDPNFAAAHAARSRSLGAIAGEYTKGPALRATYTASVSAADRAASLAPDLADAQLALGVAIFSGRLDIAAAREPFDRAYELGRGDADIAVRYALYCSRAGRMDRAREAIARAVALDPLNPRTYRAQGSIDYAARRYAESIAALNRAIELNPNIANAYYYIGASQLQLGKVEAARAAFGKEPHSLFRLSGLAVVDHKLGNKPAAKRALDEMAAELGDNSLYQQGQVLAQWGELDAALTCLERARVAGDAGLVYLGTDPMVDPLRGNPRFGALLKAIRFS